MTKRQRRLQKLGNAMRKIKGGLFTPPCKDPKALVDLGRKRLECEQHNDPIPTSL